MTMYSAKSHSLPILVQDVSSNLVFHIKHEQDIKDLNRIWRMFVAFAAALYFGLLGVVFVSPATIVGFVAPIAVAIGFCLFVLKIDVLRKNKYYDFNIVYWKKSQQIDIVSRKLDSVVASGDASSYKIRCIHFTRGRFLPCSESAACAVLVCPDKKRFVIGIGRVEEMQNCICELSIMMGVVKLEDHHIRLGMANRYNP